MHYDLNLSDCKSYVFVRPLEDVTKELAMTYTRAAVMLGDSNTIDRLLVDVRGLKSLSGAIGKYSFAHGGGEKIGLTHLWKVALIYDEGNKDVEFLETVMRNAGYNYRVFINKEEAVSWLKG